MDKPTLDVISIGDSTIDTIIQIHDAEINRDGDKSKISLDWGTKIPVDHLDHQVGGNAANNAVGSARLGLKTAIYTHLGTDDAGNRIVDKFKKEEVSTKYVEVELGKSSNYSAVLEFQGERTIFVY